MHLLKNYFEFFVRKFLGIIALKPIAGVYCILLVVSYFPDFFSSVVQLCPTLCDPMDCSTPGLPVHHQLLELAQTRVHRVGDAIQSSHALPSPSPPASNLSQHQGLFQGVNSSYWVLYEPYILA